MQRAPSVGPTPRSGGKGAEPVAMQRSNSQRALMFYRNSSRSLADDHGIDDDEEEDTGRDGRRSSVNLDDPDKREEQFVYPKKESEGLVLQKYYEHPSMSKFEKLFDAIEQGDPVKVKALVTGTVFSKGIPIETRDRFGRTPLIQAAASGKVHALKQLLVLGALINEKDNLGGTPLINAVVNGHLDCVNVLITAEANIRLPDNKGTPPIVYAAACGRWEILGALIQIGADVDTQDAEGFTPLMRAAQLPWSDNSTDIIHLLAQNQASFNLKNKYGETVFDLIKDTRTHAAVMEALREHQPDHHLIKVARKARGDSEDNAADKGKSVSTLSLADSEFDPNEDPEARKERRRRRRRRRKGSRARAESGDFENEFHSDAPPESTANLDNQDQATPAPAGTDANANSGNALTRTCRSCFGGWGGK